ncbi:MAG: hypothetical protein AAF911_01515 [Planctomycetota bacterium]
MPTDVWPRLLMVVAGCWLSGAVVAPEAVGQTLAERMEHRERTLAREADRQREKEAEAQREINRKLAARIDFVASSISVREALLAWAGQTQVPLVIDWEAMELDGVDPGVEIDVELSGVRADTVLLVLMNSMSTDLRFVAEANPWGVQLRSRERANRDVVTRVYDVRDLVMEVPHFTDAPSLSLTDALSNTGRGGEGASVGIFDVEEFSEEDRPLTRQERGDLLVQLVRDMIEPDIWQENGGEFSRVRYRDGRMIVRAPLYVHVRIGRPAIAMDLR